MDQVLLDKQPNVAATGIVGALTLTKTGTTARTATFPDASITVARTDAAQTFTGIQTVTNGLLSPSTRATTSAGYLVYNSNNDLVSSLGVGNSTNSLFAGGVNCQALGCTTIVASGVVTVPNGTAAAPGLRLTSEASGLYRVSSTSLGFAVAGTAAGALTSAGALTVSGVGVGLAPNDAFTAYTASVNGPYGFRLYNANTTGTAASCAVTMNNGAANAFIQLLVSGYTTSGINAASALVIQNQAAGGINIGCVNAAGAVALWTNSTKRFEIDNSGILSVSNTTDATTTSDGSVRLSGGLSVAANKAIVAGGNIILATATTAATAAGTLQRETNQDTHYAYTNSIGGWLDKCIFSQYATVTQSGIVTAQSLASATARGTRTLPANFFKAGKVLKFRLCGVYTTDAVPGNATIAIKIGATTIRTTASFAPDASITDGYWLLDGEFVCQTTGATGTINGQTAWMHEQVSPPAESPMYAEPMTTFGAVTIDTTASAAFDVVWTATDAGTSISCTCFRLWEVC